MTQPIERSGTGRDWRPFPAAFEVRTKPNGTGGDRVTVAGYASTTEKPYVMFDRLGEYQETVARGAFTKTLSENPKVHLSVNHGGLSLAQTTAGTLRLAEDDHGLQMEADLNPARHDVSDLLAALKGRDVDEMSFAFAITRQKWSDDETERRILEANLHRGDVSVVNVGANPTTSVAMRQLESLQGDELRAVFARLAERVGAGRADPSMTVGLRALDAMREVRAGKVLSKQNVAMLTAVLASIASADESLDDAGTKLASVLGVPDPDADDAAGRSKGFPTPELQPPLRLIRARRLASLLDL